MKRLPCLILFCLGLLAVPVQGKAVFLPDTADTVHAPVLPDSTASQPKQQRKEKTEDTKEAIKNGREDIESAILNAANDIKEDVKQEFNEKKETLIDNFNQAKESISEWFNDNIKANTVGDFAELQRQNNQDFADYLRTEWQSFPLAIDNRPVLTDGSFFTEKTSAAKADAPHARLIQADSYITPLPVVFSPVPENYTHGAGTEAVAASLNKQHFLPLKFYGKDINIHYAPSLRNIGLGKGTGKHLSKFWQYLSDQEFNPVLFQLYQYKEELALNDYQYYLLVRLFAESLFSKTQNGEPLLFTVFMLNQTGYDARIARLNSDGKSRLVILLPLFEEAYGLPYITLGHNKYYLTENNLSKKDLLGNIQVYEKAFATATHPVSFRIDPASSGLSPIYGKFQGYTFNERLAQMQADLPAGTLPLYASASFNELMEKTFRYKLKPELDSLVQKKQDQNLKQTLSEREKQEMKILYLNAFLNRCLTCQSKQSAKLNGCHLYPDMMFLKKGSGDILDRSLLLCLISNRILEIPAVLLVYPDFAMAAVALAEGEAPEDSPFSQGDSIEIDGQRYYLCGPLPKTVQEPEKASVFKW